MAIAAVTSWTWLNVSLSRLEGKLAILFSVMEERKPFVSQHEVRLKAVEDLLTRHFIELERRLADLKSDGNAARDNQRKEISHQIEKIVGDLRSDLSVLRTEVERIRKEGRA